MFAQESGTGALHFVEFIVNLKSNQMNVTVKGQSENATLVADMFEEIIESTLQ